MVEKTVEVKTISLHAKVCDSGCYDFKDAEGMVLKSLEDEYVPDFFPGQHYGDYLMLDIDIETDQIVNWKSPSAQQVKDAMEGEED